MKPLREKQRKIVNFLQETPYELGRAVGFDKLTTLHNQWIKQMMYGVEDETLQAHRGSYKTTCISIALPVMMILRPEEKTLFMRKTDGDVKEVIDQVKKILLNPITQHLSYELYGVELKLTRNSSTSIDTNLSCSTKGTTQLTGIGTNGSLTGKHFDNIFTDDIVNVKDRVSKAERERTKLVYQELQNIKNRGGRIFNTGTPWHKEDCFEIMPNPCKFDCYTTGLISERELAELKVRMERSLFSANYELKHVASEDVIFPDPQTGADPTFIEQAQLCHIDAAYTDGGDYTAFTICKKVNGKYYVFGKIWQKAVDKLEDEIIRYRKDFRAGVILCERNSDKGLLAKELKAKGERAMTYHEDENKHIKIVTHLKWVWKDVIFVEGTDKEYIDQICDYNEFADHDDAPDSLASIIRKINKSMPNYTTSWEGL